LTPGFLDAGLFGNDPCAVLGDDDLRSAVAAQIRPGFVDGRQIAERLVEVFKRVLDDAAPWLRDGEPAIPQGGV
jgi:hypothetical protein